MPQAFPYRDFISELSDGQHHNHIQNVTVMQILENAIIQRHLTKLRETYHDGSNEEQQPFH